MTLKRLGMLLCIVLLLSCGYRLAGRNIFLPEHIKNIAVIPFINETRRAEIEQRITESIMKELVKRGSYQVSSGKEGSDAFLEGRVTSFVTQPVQFTEEGIATRLEVTVTVKARLTESETEKILWDQQHFLYKEQFDLPETESDFFDQEIIAIDKIADNFARSLVTSLLEGF
jgi:TolB-like protein